LASCATELEESSTSTALTTWPHATAVSPSSVDGLIQYNWGKAIAVDTAGVIHVAWLADFSNRTNIGADGAIIYQSSRDGGATWTAPVNIAGGRVGFPKIAVSGTDVYIAYHQTTATGTQVFVASATAPSTSFTTTQISTAAGGVLPSIATAGGNVYLAWWAPGPQSVSEIYTRARLNGTWRTVTLASSDDGHTSWTPAIAAAGSEVYLAWTDERNNTDATGTAYDCGVQPMTTASGDDLCREEIYFRKSRDNGATWTDPEVRVTHDAPRLGNNAPSIAVSAGKVHVAFFRKPTPNDQIWYARSSDDGATFPAIAQLSPPGYSAMRPNVAVSGSTVEILGTMIVSGQGAFLIDAQSTTNGDTFTGQLLTSNNGEAMQPSLTFDSAGTAHALYVDKSSASSTTHQVFYMKR
jgi:hypothetical protein